jgi:hypothetical protein
MPKFLANLNLSQNELQNVVIQVLANDSDISNPVEGQIYYNSTSEVIRYYNGQNQWVTVGSDGNDPAIIDSSGTPTLATNITAAEIRTLIDVDQSGTDNSTDVTLATVSGNYLSISGQEITAGTVPISLGGTGATSAGAARTALGVDAAGTDNSTDVTLVTTSHDYLSLSGQAITLGAVSLADDVTGTLPVANGGTGATTAAGARSALGVDAAGTDNSTDVTLAGTYDYLTLSGQQITLGQIDYTTDIANTPTIPAAANNATITINAGAGLSYNVANSTDGAFTLNQSSNETFTLDVDNTVVRTSGAQTIGGDKTFSNNVTVQGTLTVEGTTTSVDSTVVNIGDNIITLNSGETGNPTQNGGVEIERGTATNASLIWDEGNDYWSAGVAGSEVEIALSNGNYTNLRAQATTKADVGLSNVENTAISSFTGTNNITTVGTISTGTWEGTAITDTYISSASTWNAKLDSAGTIATNDYARFDANGDLVGRSTSEVKSDLSLNNVTNESKSTMFNGAALTNNPTAPTQAASNDSTRIATTAFTQDAIDARSYAVSIGDGTNTSYTITHGLGTRDVIIQLYDASSYDTVFADVVRTNTTQATISFASAPTTNDVRVLVTKVV